MGKARFRTMLRIRLFVMCMLSIVCLGPAQWFFLFWFAFERLEFTSTCHYQCGQSKVGLGRSDRWKYYWYQLKSNCYLVVLLTSVEIISIVEMYEFEIWHPGDLCKLSYPRRESCHIHTPPVNWWTLCDICSISQMMPSQMSLKLGQF